MNDLNFLVIYFIVCATVILYIRNRKEKNKNSLFYNILKSTILAILLGPSVLFTMHAIIPLPALLALIAGYDTVRLPNTLVILFFLISVIINSILIFLYINKSPK